MIDFNLALNFVLGIEKGFVNNPNDSGGATNFGISLRFLRSLSDDRLKKYGFFGELDVDHIKNMTLDQAKLIYKGEFWDAAPFESLIYQKVANYVFDMSVHHGLCQAVKILQRALWAVYQRYDQGSDDGIIGQMTIAGIKGVELDLILAALMAERAGFVRMLVSENPKNKEFLNGWLTRCYRI